jgi:hypothetical protein
METLGKITLLTLTLLVPSIVRGYTFMVLRPWFVVPNFNAKPISLLLAMGLMIIVGFLTDKESKKKKNQKTTAYLGHAFLFSIMHSGVCFFFGWLIKLLMIV